MTITKNKLIAIALLYNYLTNSNKQLSQIQVDTFCEQIKTVTKEIYSENDFRINIIDKNAAIEQIIQNGVFIPYQLIKNYRNHNPYEFKFPNEQELLGIKLENNVYKINDLNALIINYKALPRLLINETLKKNVLYSIGINADKLESCIKKQKHYSYSI